MIGTVDALKRRIHGGLTPGGMRNRMEFTAAPTCDIAGIDTEPAVETKS